MFIIKGKSGCDLLLGESYCVCVCVCVSITYIYSIYNTYTEEMNGCAATSHPRAAAVCRSRSSRAPPEEWGLRRVRLRASGMRARPRPYYPLILAGPKPLMYILYRADGSPPHQVLQFSRVYSQRGKTRRSALYIRVTYIFYAGHAILYTTPAARMAPVPPDNNR